GLRQTTARMVFVQPLGSPVRGSMESGVRPPPVLEDVGLVRKPDAACCAGTPAPGKGEGRLFADPPSSHLNLSMLSLVTRAAPESIRDTTFSPLIDFT